MKDTRKEPIQFRRNEGKYTQTQKNKLLVDSKKINLTSEFKDAPKDLRLLRQKEGNFTQTHQNKPMGHSKTINSISESKGNNTEFGTRTSIENTDFGRNKNVHKMEVDV